MFTIGIMCRHEKWWGLLNKSMSIPSSVPARVNLSKGKSISGKGHQHQHRCSSVLSLFTPPLGLSPMYTCRHAALSIRDGCPLHKYEDMKSGDSRFPEAFGWLGGREDLCYVNKAGCTSCLVRARRERARASNALPHFWDKTRIMEEDTGRAGAGGSGVAEEEPFPSQLRLHFLCGEEVPCWAHSDLILSCGELPSWRAAALWTGSHRRQTEE